MKNSLTPLEILHLGPVAMLGRGVVFWRSQKLFEFRCSVFLWRLLRHANPFFLRHSLGYAVQKTIHLTQNPLIKKFKQQIQTASKHPIHNEEVISI